MFLLMRVWNVIEVAVCQLAFDALYRHGETSLPNTSSLIQNQGAVHGAASVGGLWA